MGTVGAGATYPFDTVRRRLQMQSEKPVEEHLYKGTGDCFKKIAAEESGSRIVQGFRCKHRPQCGWCIGARFLRPRQNLPGLVRLDAASGCCEEQFLFV